MEEKEIFSKFLYKNVHIFARVEDDEFKQVCPVRQVFHTSLCLIDTHCGIKCISVKYELTHSGVV